MSIAARAVCRPRSRVTASPIPRRLAVGIAAVGVVLTTLLANIAPARAQQAIVGPQTLVATGFSGMADGATPAGADPLDYRYIVPNGPSARVVDVSSLGPQGVLSRAPKPFTVTAGQVGQVFGVALDDAPAPNIYLAATAAYGVTIGAADPSGAIQRVRQGAAGADYLPGMFGPKPLGGGPGSIWRVDGATGQVALFANIGSGAPASLGGLAFDPRSRQIFVADRSTGLIHRLSLDGADRGNFDHGIEARPTAGLPDVPMSPVAIDITSADFDTEQPATWGFTDPERLIDGLAVRDDRLYYAVAAGPEIWSVGIAPDGSFLSDGRLELASPVLQPGTEIAQIAFDGEGRLYAAERAPPTGAYDFKTVAAGGDSRVLRFLPKPQPDGNPGFWLPDPQQYAIGLAPDYRNANGGVVLGRGYDANGFIRQDQCRATLWSTGEKLLGESPSIDPIDGLQANDPSLVLPANAPPASSWFVDYDDLPGDALNSGHMGALAVPPCLPGKQALVPVAPPPVINCPVGTFFVGGACLLPPSCPPGTRFRDGYCVIVGCPPNMIRVNGACVPPPQICNPYETFVNGRCIPWRCPGDLVRLSNGYCGCPQNEIYLRGKCVPPPVCPPGNVLTRDGRCLPPPPVCPPGFVTGPRGDCICPPNMLTRKGVCVPPPACQQGMVRDQNGRCVCPPNLMLRKGICVPPPVCPQSMVPGPNGRCVCPPDLILRKGVCVPPPACPRGQVRDQNGRCVCPPNLMLQKGACVPPPVCPQGMVPGPKGRCVCPPDLILRKGVCVPPVVQQCPEGQLRDQNGRCVCPEGYTLRRGVCRPPVVIDCSPGFILKGGKCVPMGPVIPIKPVCGEGQRVVNGQCVSIIVPMFCKKGWVMRDGHCIPLRQEPPAGGNDNPEPPVIRQPNIQLMVPPIKMMPMQSAPQ